ncbi:hypothetical protein AAKU61_004336 [Undibacterium sp. GrIS 1.2]|uniref:hypothetical protein n=1 Tax=Undibacterium sp. GrIS 1.2 TaxID=3143933 RepID=UPI00339A6DAB
MKFLFLSLLTFLLVTTRAFACPKQIPEGLNGVTVGSDVVTNGLAMTISQVQGRESVEEIMQRTQKTWIAAGYSVKRNSTLGWDVLSAMGNQCLVTLQLTKRNGAFGYLALSHKTMSSSVTPQSMGAPLPPNAK